MSKAGATLILAVLMAGCAKEVSVPPPRVETLAVIEGCRIYRINDGLYMNYFSTCGKVSTP